MYVSGVFCIPNYCSDSMHSMAYCILYQLDINPGMHSMAYTTVCIVWRTLRYAWYGLVCMVWPKLTLMSDVVTMI